ncbi:MAG: hypothetical protein KZQ95_03865 [Candidatus Thiodiazotropha sp. (ex Epidulcina cf. delphinae)]|nr:hypothetical protein [Candidatus Thiodiazotropha sp. (ex Epidulcina cf. delphinae)]
MASRETCLKKFSLRGIQLLESKAYFNDSEVGERGKLRVTINADLPEDISNITKDDVFHIYIHISTEGIKKENPEEGGPPSFVVEARCGGNFQVMANETFSRADIEKCLNNIVPPIYSFSRDHVSTVLEKMGLNIKLPHDVFFFGPEKDLDTTDIEDEKNKLTKTQRRKS